MTTTKLSVDVFGGPIGSCGFRSGWWTGELDGKKFKFYSSISHALDLEEQHERLLNNAAAAIERGLAKFE